MTKKLDKKCPFCDHCDIVETVQMVLDHKDVPDLIIYHCENCDYLGSVEIKNSNVFYKKTLMGYIKSIKEKIGFEESQIQDRKDTMKYFKNPSSRIKGIDIIKYELEIPILKQQLKFLEKVYLDSYGEGN